MEHYRRLRRKEDGKYIKVIQGSICEFDDSNSEMAWYRVDNLEKPDIKNPSDVSRSEYLKHIVSYNMIIYYENTGKYIIEKK